MSADALAIRATGVPVQGQVTDLHDPLRRTDYIDVSYAYEGRPYQAKIAVPDATSHETGQQIGLYVDPSNPDDVVTAEGHSESAPQRNGIEVALIFAMVVLALSVGRGIWNIASWRRSL